MRGGSSHARGLAFAFAASLYASGSAAHAAPAVFDCDTSTDHSSSYTVTVGQGFRASGAITPVAMRSGRAPANGGVTLTSPDGSAAIGVQATANAADPKRVDLSLITLTNGKVERVAAGTVALATAAPFVLAIDAAGTGRLQFGQLAFDLKLGAFGGGKVQAFCASGQFRVDGLEIVSP